jgi:hypothetical protein
VMTHGLGSFRVRKTLQRLNTSRINAVHLVYKLEPDSRGLVPGIHASVEQ